MMIGLIKRNFNYLTVPTFILLYKWSCLTYRLL